MPTDCIRKSFEFELEKKKHFSRGGRTKKNMHEFTLRVPNISPWGMYLEKLQRLQKVVCDKAEKVAKFEIVLMKIGLLLQTMNDSRALKRRVFKYLVPVTLISIVFNITKFFEIQVVWNPINNGTLLDPSSNETTIDNTTEYRIGLKITEFRTDPMYSINFNWFRFIAIGVLPFLLLVFFNTQIYLDIRKQRRRKRAAKAKRYVNGQKGLKLIPKEPFCNFKGLVTLSVTPLKASLG